MVEQKVICAVGTDHDLLEFLKILVTEENCNFSGLFKSCSAELLLYLKNGSFDLILLDPGWQQEIHTCKLVNSLRTNPSTCQTPVIIFTSPNYPLKWWHQNLPMPKVKIITKPFDLNNLLEAIYASLGESIGGKVNLEQLPVFYLT